MRITKRAVYQMNDDGSFTELERDSYEYDGPVSKCFGGKSSTAATTNTTTDIDTKQAGIENVEGIGLAATGDIEFNQEVTDLGAVQGAFDAVGGAFDFANEFAEDAFNFANNLGQAAVETSQQGVATVATGGQSDIVRSQNNTVTIVAIAAAVALFGSQILRSIK